MNGYQALVVGLLVALALGVWVLVVAGTNAL